MFFQKNYNFFVPEPKAARLTLYFKYAIIDEKNAGLFAEAEGGVRTEKEYYHEDSDLR